jgi:hypothetical protein
MLPENPNNQNKAKCPNREFQPNIPSNLEKRQTLSCLRCGLDSKLKKVMEVDA